MKTNNSKLQLARKETETAINRTNELIVYLGEHLEKMYNELSLLQEHFDRIRNVPSKSLRAYKEIKQLRLTWKQHTEKIERDFKQSKMKGTGAGAAGVGAGVAVVTLGPSIAMGVATTFGVASTGTAISTLSGAAATNAALAWLGGGALAAGGGGMAAGNAFLALAGPVGWTIAGISFLFSGVFIWKSVFEKNRLEDIFTLISDRDTKKYQLAMNEINNRINDIDKEVETIIDARCVISSFGTDYNVMTTEQKFILGAAVNQMRASTQLLINPIKNLQPNYDEKDYNEFVFDVSKTYILSLPKYKELIIAFANLFYNIIVDERDIKIIFNSFKNNKELLNTFGISKKDFKLYIIEDVFDALNKKYKSDLIKMYNC